MVDFLHRGIAVPQRCPGTIDGMVLATPLMPQFTQLIKNLENSEKKTYLYVYTYLIYIDHYQSLSIYIQNDSESFTVLVRLVDLQITSFIVVASCWQT